MIILLNKELNFALNNMDNYKDKLTASVDDILKKYYTIIREYIKHSVETIIVNKKTLKQFIITRGLDTITHVFMNLLYYTNNIDLVVYHCEKSLYFYIEFVSQISQEDKSFLELSSRDASTYVYKKTIYDINNEKRKNKNLVSQIVLNDLRKIEYTINIFKHCLYKIIKTDNFDTTLQSNYELIEKIILKIDNNKLLIDELELLDKITNITISKIMEISLFIDFYDLLLKKIIKNPSSLHNLEDSKFSDIVSNLKYYKDINKYVNLLLS